MQVIFPSRWPHDKTRAFPWFPYSKLDWDCLFFIRYFRATLGQMISSQTANVLRLSLIPIDGAAVLHIGPNEECILCSQSCFHKIILPSSILRLTYLCTKLALLKARKIPIAIHIECNTLHSALVYKDKICTHTYMQMKWKTGNPNYLAITWNGHTKSTFQWLHCGSRHFIAKDAHNHAIQKQNKHRHRRS